MAIYDLLFPLRARRRVARLAATVGRRSLPQAAAAIGDRASSMTLSEGRGFARARARMAVEAELDALLSSGEILSQAMHAELVEQALEQVVVRIVAQQIVDKPVWLPVRRAA